MRRSPSVVSKFKLPTKTLFISFFSRGCRRCAGSGFAADLFRSEAGIDLVAMLGAHARRRSEIRKFHDHERSDESLQAVLVEVNGRLTRIGFGDHSHAVAVVLDVLPFGNHFHMSSFVKRRKLFRGRLWLSRE